VTVGVESSFFTEFNAQWQEDPMNHPIPTITLALALALTACQEKTPESLPPPNPAEPKEQRCYFDVENPDPPQGPWLQALDATWPSNKLQQAKTLLACARGQSKNIKTNPPLVNGWLFGTWPNELQGDYYRFLELTEGTAVKPWAQIEARIDVKSKNRPGTVHEVAVATSAVLSATEEPFQFLSLYLTPKRVSLRYYNHGLYTIELEREPAKSVLMDAAQFASRVQFNPLAEAIVRRMVSGEAEPDGHGLSRCGHRSVPRSEESRALTRQEITATAKARKEPTHGNHTRSDAIIQKFFEKTNLLYPLSTQDCWPSPPNIQPTQPPATQSASSAVTDNNCLTRDTCTLVCPDNTKLLSNLEGMACMKGDQPTHMSYRWYPTGERKRMWLHKGDTIEQAIGYYQSGQKKDVLTKTKHEEWYENGVRKSLTIGTDLDSFMSKNYTTTEWHENGHKKSVTTYKNGKIHGIERSFYENGKKSIEAEMNADKLHGLYTSWYENGQLNSKANYSNHKLDGAVTVWHPNGQKKSEAQYKEGQQLSQTCWDDKGQTIDCPKD